MRSVQVHIKQMNGWLGKHPTNRCLMGSFLQTHCGSSDPSCLCCRRNAPNILDGCWVRVRTTQDFWSNVALLLGLLQL